MIEFNCPYCNNEIILFNSAIPDELTNNKFYHICEDCLEVIECHLEVECRVNAVIKEEK